LLFAIASMASAQAPRPHIVFLLGADREAGGFFTAARHYFRDTDEAARIVDDARTLAQVREELKQRAGAAPWGRIVLVAHGTQWTGLVVPLFDARTPATLSALQAARASGEFPPLPLEIIDAQTELVVESCGLGRREDYLADLAALFVEEPGQRPRVRASRNMVWFGTGAEDGAVRRELPYRARILRGESSARRNDAITAELRADLTQEIGSDERFSAIVLPVRVQVAATAAQVGAVRNIESYVQALPAGRIDLGGAGFAGSDFLWKRKDGVSGTVELAGEATLVLVMQSVPNAATSMPQTLNLGE
jgi:hypothetical protein